MSLQSRIDKLETNVAVIGSDGCRLCRGEVYLPDAVNTEERVYFHGPCKGCGRVWTETFGIVYARDAARFSRGGGEQ